MELRERYPELEFLEQVYQSEEISWDEGTIAFSPDVDVIYLYQFTPAMKPLVDWVLADPRRDLIVIEDRIASIAHITEEGYTSYFPDQVHFRFKMPEIDLAEFTSYLARDFPWSRVDVVSLNKSPFFEELKLLLMRKSVLEEAVLAEMLHYHKLYANLSTHFPKLEEAFDVAKLKNAFQGIPAILCGAGPSLAGVKEALKKAENKALLLGGGSAITALGSMGIEPHFIYALDPNEEEFTRLKGHSLFGVPFVFAPRLHKEVLLTHKGPIGYFPTGTGGGIEHWFEKELGIEDPKILEKLGEEALSVITIALMTAIHFGCNPIYFAGIDLAYGSGKRYAPGVVSDMQCRLEEVGGKTSEAKIEVDGAITATKWIMERDVIDDVIVNHPDRTFIRITPPGLPFKGAPYNPDWEASLGSPKDMKGIVHEKLMEATSPFPKGGISEKLEEFKQSLIRCLTFVEELEKETGPRAIVYEMDLEEEIAYTIALKPAVYALSMHLHKEVRFDEAKRKTVLYGRLAFIIREYLTYFAS